MKIGFALFLATTIGGWLYVELSPYPAHQRINELMQLPGAKQVVEWNDMRSIRSAFDAAEDGTVSVTRRGSTINWNSFEDWKTDFEAHDRDARFWYNKVQNAEAFEKLAEEADEGSLSALRSLALMGVGQTESGASVSDLLRSNGSATAQMTLQQFVNQSFDTGSRQGMLLSAQSMQENYRWEGMTDAMFEEVTASNQRGLRTLQQHAEAGDPDAKWVWGKLHGDTKVRMQVRD